MWQLQVVSINAGYEHDHATSGLHFLSRVLFCLVSYRASLYKTMLFMFVQKSRIQFWLFEQKDMRIEGRIIGFDEYMNLVLDDAEEISLKKKTRKPLGRILLKGDNITLMMNTGK
jgi:small nuclear ribonucleoprotein E